MQTKVLVFEKFKDASNVMASRAFIDLIRTDVIRVHFPSYSGLKVLDPPQGDLEFVLHRQGLRLRHLQLLLQVGLLVRELQLPGLDVGHLLPQISEDKDVNDLSQIQL